jgi:hypothetical protein
LLDDAALMDDDAEVMVGGDGDGDGRINRGFDGITGANNLLLLDNLLPLDDDDVDDCDNSGHNMATTDADVGGDDDDVDILDASNDDGTGRTMDDDCNDGGIGNNEEDKSMMGDDDTSSLSLSFDSLPNDDTLFDCFDLDGDDIEDSEVDDDGTGNGGFDALLLL